MQRLAGLPDAWLVLTKMDLSHRQINKMAALISACIRVLSRH